MSAPYYGDESVTLWHGLVAKVLPTLADGSVDCVVTSPPYYGLRDYGVAGQLGLEASPAEYVAAMRDVFTEARRVLADHGTLWLNLGDSYVSASGGAPQSSNIGTNGGTRFARPRSQDFMPPKNLLGMPWRVAFALQDDGWILRSEVIWAKRNCLPDPATDRPARTHEHVFLFSKKPRYWYDADAIREDSDPEQTAHNERYAKEYEAHTARAGTTGQPGNVNNLGIHSRPGKAGRNARSVWPISAQPFPGAHFATMPPELARRCVAAGCKPNGTVLDPFSGSGTTGAAALALGRRYIGIDLSAEYLDLSLRTRLAQTALIDGATA